MSNNFDEFKRSLDQLVAQAQQTAQLGFDVAKEQVETLVHPPQDLNAQMDEVRRNLQAMARDMETKAQELVHLASTYVSQGMPMTGFPGTTAGQPPRSTQTRTQTADAPENGESHTAAGAGTPQTGSNAEDSDATSSGEAPKQ